MKIHEHQAKELLKKYELPILKSAVAFSAEEVGKLTWDLFESQGTSVVVLKAQIHAGGRGKGVIHRADTNEPVEFEGKLLHGVTIIKNGQLADKAYRISKEIFGNKLVTLQTGAEGKIVNRVLIEEGCNIEREYYVGIVLDRQLGKNTIMASTQGGMEIEKVAEETPELILKEVIDPKIGFQDYQARRLAFGLGLEGATFKNFVEFIHNLVFAYDELDCSLLEINPLVLTSENRFVLLDAKITFDDNAVLRHSDYLALRDTSEEDPLEVEASKYDLNYIKLDGNVGCMVNGAGLAMATMDMIKLSGGSPANFLDVGGGANVERIANAFRIMMNDPNVKAVLINIFGGIVRCDKVANGIVEALKTVQVNLPVIVRLDGTNSEEGKQILLNSGLQFEVASDLKEAAELVTKVLSNN
ncbi:MAG TPA: ADP-forming succinate--CoA ligase subunit beta [Candidatus Kapabacteria bacterium]|nr:ADP-forming succinate--CoA ligase subunit beta [Candidatus Kapabacteria bacterium]